MPDYCSHNAFRLLGVNVSGFALHPLNDFACSEAWRLVWRERPVVQVREPLHQAWWGLKQCLVEKDTPAVAASASNSEIVTRERKGRRTSHVFPSTSS